MSGDWPSQRIALCQAGPLHYKVIATTGPKRGSIGMKMNEFAKFVNQQGEHEEAVAQQLHLQDGVLHGHGAHGEFLGARTTLRSPVP